MARKNATFAAGCFWGVEREFSRVKGVSGTEVGYTGGHTENPTYEQVCTDKTGHAEAVRVEYDPSVVTYGELLDEFWSIHDPTLVNRQGPDVGSQYRSAIFYHDEIQMREAMASKKRLDASGELSRPVATEIAPAQPFHRAEEHHQRYHEKNGTAGCAIRRK
ncbi:MAG: peptide-methionine (S)-S-oxide reductase MsrA [Methanobacteriota archaeon]